MKKGAKGAKRAEGANGDLCRQGELMQEGQGSFFLKFKVKMTIELKASENKEALFERLKKSSIGNNGLSDSFLHSCKDKGLKWQPFLRMVSCLVLLKRLDVNSVLVSEVVCAYKMSSLIHQIGPLLLAMKQCFSIQTNKGKTQWK